MIQADTIWRKDLFSFLDPKLLMENDIVFDSEGETGLLKKMIAGGYFFVNGNERTTFFFEVNDEIILSREELGFYCILISLNRLIAGNSQFSTRVLCY